MKIEANKQTIEDVHLRLSVEELTFIRMAINKVDEDQFKCHRIEDVLGLQFSKADVREVKSTINYYIEQHFLTFDNYHK